MQSDRILSIQSICISLSGAKSTREWNCCSRREHQQLVPFWMICQLCECWQQRPLHLLLPYQRICTTFFRTQQMAGAGRLRAAVSAAQCIPVWPAGCVGVFKSASAPPTGELAESWSGARNQAPSRREKLASEVAAASLNLCANKVAAPNI